MPLIYLGIGWFIGIWATSALQLPIEILLIFTLVPIIGLILWRGDRRARVIWLGMLFAVFGGLRHLVSLPHFDQTSLSTYNNTGEVTLEGVIEADPDVRDTYINLCVSVDQLALPDGASRPIDGTALVQPSRPAEFQYGDRVRVSGELVAPPEFATFSYQDYLARQGIYAMVDRPRVSVRAHDQGSPILAALFAFRDQARRVITQILPEPQASLLNGILLGDDAGLPASVQDEFRATGTTHLIAISGYNITILVSILSALTVRLVGRRRSFPILIIGLIAYTALVGASASVVRAAVMGFFTVLAIYFGRQAAALNSLFGAGLVMTALDPGTLYDIGFQLSFVATLGLILYAKPFADTTERWLARLFSNKIAKTVVDVVNDALLVTLAAQVATLPLLVVYFRQVSLISLIVNPLVLPAQTGVMVFGLLALAAGLIWLPLGRIVGWSAWLFLAWTTGIIHVFASVPNAVIPLSYVDPLWPILYYVILAAATWYLSRPSDKRPKLVARSFTPRRMLFAGGMSAVLLGVALSWQPDGRLHVIALDVDGHPILVHTPGGQQILIGGSSSPSALLTVIGQQLPFWDHDLDLMIAPQTTTAQLNGLLGVLERYQVRSVAAVEASASNRAGRDWNDALGQHDLEPMSITDAQAIEIEPGVVIKFDSGSVLIESGGTTIGIGPSPRAQIDFIDEPAVPLPLNAQLILAWNRPDDQRDPRVIALPERGSIDITLDSAGVVISTLQ